MNFEKRIDKLIKLIEQKELDAVILGGRANIRYLLVCGLILQPSQYYLYQKIEI